MHCHPWLGDVLGLATSKEPSYEEPNLARAYKGLWRRVAVPSFEKTWPTHLCLSLTPLTLSYITGHHWLARFPVARNDSRAHKDTDVTFSTVVGLLWSRSALSRIRSTPLVRSHDCSYQPVSAQLIRMSLYTFAKRPNRRTPEATRAAPFSRFLTTNDIIADIYCCTVLENFPSCHDVSHSEAKFSSKLRCLECFPTLAA